MAKGMDANVMVFGWNRIAKLTRGVRSFWQPPFSAYMLMR